METQTILGESHEQEYERRAHSVGISIWHFEWCSKYRYKMFRKEEYCNLIAACIRRAASEHGIKIVILAVQPEHTYCEVELTLAMSPSWALQILKGRSSFLFFQFHERARLRLREYTYSRQLQDTKNSLNSWMHSRTKGSR